MNVASVKCVPATVPATKNLLEVDPSEPVIFECDQGGKFVVRIVGSTLHVAAKGGSLKPYPSTSSELHISVV